MTLIEIAMQRKSDFGSRPNEPRESDGNRLQRSLAASFFSPERGTFATALSADYCILYNSSNCAYIANGILGGRHYSERIARRRSLYTELC